jgi:DNA-binding LacI/PurR family transcriptional regulator
VEKLVAHFKKYPQITAVFAAEYDIALLALEAAEQLGMRVPEELSILCFDSPHTERHSRITHLKQNQFDMGEKAFEMVLQHMQAQEQSGVKRVVLPASMVKGTSTSQVREHAVFQPK